MLLPLFAMQITDEVKWDAADFAILGAMLGAVCGTFELAARMSGDILLDHFQQGGPRWQDCIKAALQKTARK